MFAVLNIGHLQCRYCVETKLKNGFMWMSEIVMLCTFYIANVHLIGLNY